MEIELKNRQIRLPVRDLIAASQWLQQMKEGDHEAKTTLYIKKAWLADRELVLEINSPTLDVEIKRKYKKRSTDANAYAWHLIGELADKVGADKELIYIVMLERYGQGGVVKIRDKDAAAFKKTVKYWREHEKLTDENAAYYRFWVGSSQYNTKEMSIFIDGIISECREQGIETMTRAELERLKSEW